MRMIWAAQHRFIRLAQLFQCIQYALPQFLNAAIKRISLLPAIYGDDTVDILLRLLNERIFRQLLQRHIPPRIWYAYLGRDPDLFHTVLFLQSGALFRAPLLDPSLMRF